MFGTNEIVGQKYFKDAPSEALFVTSMFFTLQGEGPYAGMASLFIRFTKCNLACSFCDTFFDDGDWMTFEELELKAKATIKEYFNGNAPKWAVNEDGGPLFPGVVLVITGGEPTLQKNLTGFLQRQVPEYRAVQIESNGTVNLEIPKGVTLVCSPKCAEKNGIATKYLSPTKQILERADCLKFVISADEDSPYFNIPEWAHEWRRNRGGEVYISPMNIYNTYPQTIKLLRSEKQGNITLEERSTVDEVINFFEPGLLDMEQIAKNHQYAGEYCMKHGFRMQMQMHLFANLA